MYRLLVVDDEAIITDGVSEIIGGLNIPGLDICKAYSGIEALDWLDNTRVDIVLSDIRMPELNGLELMGIIRKKWPRCRIIFLTGFDDFDTVYKAIQFQGARFLLKTEGYSKVIAEVQEAIRELEEELRTEYLLREAVEQRYLLDTIAQGDYFRQLLVGTKIFDPEERDMDFRNLSIPLDAHQLVLPVLGSLLKTTADPSYTRRQEMALDAKYLVDRYLQDQTRCVCIIDRYGDLLWLIQPLEPKDDGTNKYIDVIRFLEGTLELAQKACSEVLGIELAFTVSGQACAWNVLSVTYERIRQLQHVRIGDGTSMVMTADVSPQDPKTPGPTRDTIRSERFELLAGHMESGRSDAFLSLLHEIFLPIQRNPVIDKIQAMELYYSAALVILSYINRRQLQDLVPIAALMQFDTHSSWEEGSEYLNRISETLFSHRRCGEGNRAAGAVQEIMTYIEEYLDEDLSLVRLSKRFHFNPSYLSRVFKQESGMNLSDFIDKARLRKAKEMLTREELRINEISLNVGYESPHSFTRFFKKLTGTTPQEYREAIRDFA